MSELISIVDQLRAEDLVSLPDARAEEDFVELHEALERLEAERLRRLADLDRRRVFERDGHLSAASWLVNRFRVGWGEARARVRLARALERMPGTRKALEDGELSTAAARVLADAREADHEAFEDAEERLVEAATIHSTGDLRRVAVYWREAVERERGLDRGEKLLERRRLHASATFMGMVRVDGDLDPETGETFLTALKAILDAESRSGDADERTPGQRRADALGEICRQWLDLTERPTVAGEKPHLIVTVPIEALSGGSEHPAELDHSGPVPVELARRVSCDASVMRVVMAGSSEPLDVGRRTPMVPPSLRRAVIVRDRRCRFPGCDRPHTWCDAHHVVHWADGGPTSLLNLMLLCRRHHRLVHQRGGFSLEVDDGHPVFRRPDGSTLEDRAPP